MARTDIPLPQQPGFAQTQRKDNWWVAPLLTFLGLSGFIVYGTWAALQAKNYFYHDDGAQYLSPMYSPLLFAAPNGEGLEHAWFGAWPDWLKWLPGFMMTPAFLILWGPGLFRFTCYYYRGAYYKAFWADPVSCAVGEPKFRGKNYRGEHSFPLILQNIHRYALYVALFFIVVLTYDAVISFIWKAPGGGYTFGVGVGSLVLVINVYLLGGYTFGCHSFRHLIGGRRDHISENAAQFKAYQCVSCLNRRHMMWAWFSLFWVGFTDFYIRMCAAGVWTDLHWVAGG